MESKHAFSFAKIQMSLASAPGRFIKITKIIPATNERIEEGRMTNCEPTRIDRERCCTFLTELSMPTVSLAQKQKNIKDLCHFHSVNSSMSIHEGFVCALPRVPFILIFTAHVWFRTISSIEAAGFFLECVLTLISFRFFVPDRDSAATDGLTFDSQIIL